MRFLLDTNVLIPLEDSQIPLQSNLANFVRLAQENGHPLLYHPASEEDISRDRDLDRRQRTIQRLKQYVRLDSSNECPWNLSHTSANDRADNAILYALSCDAVHALVTEDRSIHDKAKSRGLVDRVYTIQTAEDLLRRLHESTYIRLPNIEDVALHTLTPVLQDAFFDSLRSDYGGSKFDEWFRSSARSGRRAWVYWGEDHSLGALCIYTRQDDEAVTDDQKKLPGAALKLGTFKVGPSCRGRKVGELFLKAAFRYATTNRLSNIFIHGNPEKQHFLFQLLIDFGFFEFGTYKDDVVFVKNHPISPPSDVSQLPFEYFKKYYPHYRHGVEVQKFIIPIKPDYHRILFPDYESMSDKQLVLFRSINVAGNAIKLAYLCHAQTSKIHAGDIALFYRSTDEKSVTSIGVVESYEELQDADEIARRVSRRTVYSMTEVSDMATRPTKVMLFRLAAHLTRPLSHGWLAENGIVTGNIQTIRKIENDAFDLILNEQ